MGHWHGGELGEEARGEEDPDVRLSVGRVTGPGWERDGDPVLPHSQKSAHLRRQVAYFRLGLANTMASGALSSRNWLSFPLGEATN